MSADLTPQGAAAVRLALDVVRLKAERDRARGIAVGLEQRLARVERLAEGWETFVDSATDDRIRRLFGLISEETRAILADPEPEGRA